MSHDFEVVGSELLLDAPIIAVRRDEVVMPGAVSYTHLTLPTILRV